MDRIDKLVDGLAEELLRIDIAAARTTRMDPAWRKRVAKVLREVVQDELAHLTGTRTAPEPASETMSRAYLIRRHGAYFRPAACGYTDEIVTAGLFAREEAEACARTEGTTAHHISEFDEEIRDLWQRAQLLMAVLEASDQEGGDNAD